MTKLIASFVLFTAVAAAAVDLVPAGTNISIRTNGPIARNRANGEVYTGTVAEDVRDRDGNLAIPRGANAELILRRVGSDLVIDLDGVEVYGQRFEVAATEVDRRSKDGVGMNRRTGKYVGGGAVLGTLLGAIAGGGKGAAIGALAGGAAGAGGEVLTRGRSVNIPAESILNFQLTQPLQVTSHRDQGYNQGGRHYHRY